MDDVYLGVIRALADGEDYTFLHAGVEFTVRGVAGNAALIASTRGRERIDTLQMPFSSEQFWETVGALRGQLKVAQRYAPMTLPYASYRDASAALAEDREYELSVDGITLLLTKRGDVADWCHLLAWKGNRDGEPSVDVLLHSNFGPAQFWFAVGEAVTEAL